MRLGLAVAISSAASGFALCALIISHGLVRRPVDVLRTSLVKDTSDRPPDMSSLDKDTSDRPPHISLLDAVKVRGRPPKVNRIKPKGRVQKRARGSIPKIIHTVWMANPLNPYALASLDSVLRFMSDVTFKLHILTPSGANATVLSAIYSQFEAQLKPFLDIPGFDLRILLHDDIPSELIGTPLEGKGITQEHMGGTVERLLPLPLLASAGDRAATPHGAHSGAMVHASDFYRILCLYRDGGLWIDTDHIMLLDIFPLLDSVGPFVLCQGAFNLNDLCSLLNGFFAAAPRHPFLLDGLHRVAELIETHHVNGLFPIRDRQRGDPPKAPWVAVGPGLFTHVSEKWLQQNEDLWVVPSGYPHQLTIQKLRHRPGGLVYPYPTSPETSMTILPRKYFIPTSFKNETLSQPMSYKFAEMYAGAYSFHMWEWTSNNTKVRMKFVEIVRDSPGSVLAYLFRRTCLMICDPDDLVRGYPTLDELIRDRA